MRHLCTDTPSNILQPQGRCSIGKPSQWKLYLYSALSRGKRVKDYLPFYLKKKKKKKKKRSFHCGATESVVLFAVLGCSFDPGLAQGVKDLALLQLGLRSQLQLRSDPWLGNSICHGLVKKEREREKKILKLVV